MTDDEVLIYLDIGEKCSDPSQPMFVPKKIRDRCVQMFAKSRALVDVSEPVYFRGRKLEVRELDMQKVDSTVCHKAFDIMDAGFLDISPRVAGNGWIGIGVGEMSGFIPGATLQGTYGPAIRVVKHEHTKKCSPIST